MSKFPNITDGQYERIGCLFEEIGEVLQELGKIQRHGFDSYHPRDPNKVLNRDRLATELGHLRWAISKLCLMEDIDEDIVVRGVIEKSSRFNNYLHYEGKK